MALLVVGLALVALGLFCGAALVAAAFGVGAMEPSMTLWVLFPAFSIVGYGLFVVGARVATIGLLSSLVSYLLLTLAMASAAGLVLSAASLMQLAGGSASLWYVLVVAGVLGTVGAATQQRAAANSVA